MLRLVAVFVWLGYHVNFKKSSLVPRQKDGAFLGVIHDTPLLRFFLTERRCVKLFERVAGLWSRVRPGRPIPARAVVKTAVDTIFSAQVVCHRAVAMMCRAIILTLTVMLASWDTRVRL